MPAASTSSSSSPTSADAPLEQVDAAAADGDRGRRSRRTAIAATPSRSAAATRGRSSSRSRSPTGSPRRIQRAGGLRGRGRGAPAMRSAARSSTSSRVAGEEFVLRAERGRPEPRRPGWTQKTERRPDRPLPRRRPPRDQRRRHPRAAATAPTTAPTTFAPSSPSRSRPPPGPGEWSTSRTRALDAFDSDDARLLESIAAQLGGAMQRDRPLRAPRPRLPRHRRGALGAALEAKDSSTASHSQSITDNAVAVGRRLGMGAEDLRMLRYAAAFHDIGKLAIPREILHKPGPLDPDEWAKMKQHTVYRRAHPPADRVPRPDPPDRPPRPRALGRRRLPGRPRRRGHPARLPHRLRLRRLRRDDHRPHLPTRRSRPSRPSRSSATAPEASSTREVVEALLDVLG